MSNLALEQALARDNIPFARSKVGDRYVMETLQEKQWQLGGESSGHIIWLHSQTTGDGVVSALQVLTLMQRSGKKLRDLLVGMKKCPQVLINVPMPEKPSAAKQTQLDEVVAATEKKLGTHGRVLLRASGTEPLMRVMIEGNDAALIQRETEALAKQVEQILKL